MYIYFLQNHGHHRMAQLAKVLFPYSNHGLSEELMDYLIENLRFFSLPNLARAGDGILKIGIPFGQPATVKSKIHQLQRAFYEACTEKVI